ncbi:MAG: hypothetical protein HY558_04555 [Euryarchaeota archaeon]|nr:hypothetical protein [Euryarchaeota archaeon]
MTDARLSEVPPGVLAILQFVREGARKRGQVIKRLGLPPEQAEPWLKEAAAAGYLAEEKGRLVLTPKGLAEVLALEQRRPIVMPPHRWKHEMWLDKAAGGVLMAVGISLVYTGFTLGLQIFNTPAPQFEAPNLNIGSLLGRGGGEGGDLGSAVFGPMQQMFSSSILTAFKAAGAGIIVSAGGVLLSRGVQLFKRP